jgi:hypothetical protein
MKIFLTLISCLALTSIATAAQQDDNSQKKKKGQGQSGPVQASQPAGNPKGAGKAHVYSNTQLQNQKTFSKTSTLHANDNLPAVQHHKDIKVDKDVTVNKTFNKTVNKNVTVNKNFKVQHFNLGNKPNPKYQVVKFNKNFKIAGAQNWKGPKYAVFVNYQPVWHDQFWWSSHHNHIVFVFGSPYFWDAGYWYPCWGYNPGANYYFDGPIYASNPEVDPGQVVANVQSALQQQGYYQGDIDGILGPQTRAALADYQSAQGLEPTGAVDEPTLETLGMA